MKKIADNYYQFKEQINPTTDVWLTYTVDKIDGEILDTSVELRGLFTISGNERIGFAEKLGALIDEYRI